MSESLWIERGLPKARAQSVKKRIEEILFPLPESVNTAQGLRAHWDGKFLVDGWAKNYALPQSNLTISYCAEEVGVCVQLGNISRLYADLLKLEVLYKMGRIRMGVIVIPSDAYSASLGSNYASLSRASRDIKTLEPALSLPLLLITVDGGRGPN
jgi:hypothetical protein